MNPTATRILGIDASLRSTGVGVIDAFGSRLLPVYYAAIRNPPTRPLSAALITLQDEVARLIESYRPQAAAFEAIFYAKNVKTMLILSHARGVLVAQCARMGLPVYEYEPRRVKMAVTGNGAAQKQQVQKMVKVLLALPEEPQHDAADALAIAITHLHAKTAVPSTPI